MLDNSVIHKLVALLDEEIDSIVERKLEQKLPDIVRALGIRDSSDIDGESHIELVGAIEVAKLLGKDVSTPEDVLRAKKHVYNLARKKLIPSVRVSPRCVKFDLNEVKRVIANGGNAVPYSRAA